MRVDLPRLRQYLLGITKNAVELRELIEQNQLGPDILALKAAKYMLVELGVAEQSGIRSDANLFLRSSSRKCIGSLHPRLEFFGSCSSLSTIYGSRPSKLITASKLLVTALKVL